jgi:HAD superfamily hydrolase (TIGR01509 family)
MDGVIVHNDYYHCEGWQKFAKKYGFEISADDVKKWFGNTNRDILQRLFDQSLDDETIFNMSEEKEALYREAFAPFIKPLAGLEDFLKRSLNGKWVAAVATSAPASNVEFVMKNTGLAGYFKTITDETAVRRGKPDPEIYLKTAEFLRIDPGHCIVFEDSLYGIEAAQRAGMKVVAVATSHPPEKFKEMDFVIKNFEGLTTQILVEKMYGI